LLDPGLADADLPDTNLSDTDLADTDLESQSVRELNHEAFASRAWPGCAPGQDIHRALSVKLERADRCGVLLASARFVRSMAFSRSRSKR
jgi:uncharacterized protein YjbI with pentapeptide repeats